MLRKSYHIEMDIKIENYRIIWGGIGDSSDRCYLDQAIESDCFECFSCVKFPKQHFYDRQPS